MNEDPGWRLSPWMFRFLIPYAGVRSARSEADGLLVLRSLFLSFCTSLILFGVVVAFVTDKSASENVGWIVAIAIVGIASLVLVRFLERPLDCSTPDALASSYRNLFFTRIACAEVPALFAFVAGFSRGPWWSYYLGLVFTAIGFWRAVPSVGNLALYQRQLTANGCAQSLVGVLRTRPAQGG
jgi:hypothetical protein